MATPIRAGTIRHHQTDPFAETLPSKVAEAVRSGESFDSLEREILRVILSVGRQAVDLGVRLRGDGDPGDGLTTQDGVTLHRRAGEASGRRPDCLRKMTVGGGHSPGAVRPGAVRPGAVRPVQFGPCSSARAGWRESRPADDRLDSGDFFSERLPGPGSGWACLRAAPSLPISSPS